MHFDIIFWAFSGQSISLKVSCDIWFIPHFVIKFIALAISTSLILLMVPLLSLLSVSLKPRLLHSVDISQI